MLTVSVCYGPDAIVFEALLLLLTLWFLGFFFSPPISRLIYYTGILVDKGPFPLLRLASGALARPQHFGELAGAPEPLLDYLGRCKVCTPSAATLYPERHGSNLRGVLESSAWKRGV